MLKIPRLLLLVSFLGLLVVPAEAKPAKMLDLVDSLAANRIATRFSAMVQAADLATFLSSRGPFTLFVPTDAAFSRIPPDVYAALLRPENKERLQHIVLLHVVNGKKLSVKDLLTATNLLSCEGTPLPVKKSRSGAQTVLKARIVHGDIRCLNGVIHEIDAVLLPPETSMPALVLVPPAPPVAPSSGTNAPPSGPQDPPASVETNPPPANPITPVPLLETTPH